MTTQLENKVAVITGAAGNLGAAVGNAFVAAGARTLLVDREAAALERVFQADASRVLLGSIDLGSEEGARAIAAAARDRFGRIDVLVHTVGGFIGGKALHEEDLSTWDAMLTINLRTTVLACRAVVPAMLEQGSGSIVVVSAGAALKSPAGLAAYSASKAGVLKLTESLAAEVKDRGIRVNAVLPGTIDTPQNRTAMPGADVSRWVKPEHIASVIAFLASDAAQAVNGAAVPVFGRG